LQTPFLESSLKTKLKTISCDIIIILNHSHLYKLKIIVKIISWKIIFSKTFHLYWTTSLLYYNAKHSFVKKEYFLFRFVFSFELNDLLVIVSRHVDSFLSTNSSWHQLCPISFWPWLLTCLSREGKLIGKARVSSISRKYKLT